MTILSSLISWTRPSPQTSRERMLAKLASDIDRRLELRRIGRDHRKSEARAREFERLRLQMQRDPLMRGRR